jgi:hypothetical protein
MFNPELVGLACQKIAESDLGKLRDLNSLLLAVLKDDHEEVRLQIAFLANAYGIAFDESTCAKNICIAEHSRQGKPPLDSA